MSQNVSAYDYDYYPVAQGLRDQKLINRRSHNLTSQWKRSMQPSVISQEKFPSRPWHPSPSSFSRTAIVRLDGRTRGRRKKNLRSICDRASKVAVVLDSQFFSMYLFLPFLSSSPLLFIFFFDTYHFLCFNEVIRKKMWKTRDIPACYLFDTRVKVDIEETFVSKLQASCA